MALGWLDTSPVDRKGWTCGYCGKNVGGDVGYVRESEMLDRGAHKIIYICPHCENPTAFIEGDGGIIQQVPNATYGADVESLPSAIHDLYQEVRRCMQYTAYTSAVLAMRKMLMHVAVDCGAPGNKRFVEYVNYLDESHYIPPNAREWVDAIRKMGNEATHEIVIVSELDAKNLLDFSEMLLKIVYEFPARIAR